MRRIVLISGSVLFVILALFVVAQKQAEVPSISNKEAQVAHTLSIGESTIFVELATTETERVLGLGGRETLAQNAGMLFVFPHMALPGIWMKGMKFPLDIVWLIEEQKGNERSETRLRVVDMKENIAPKTFPKVFFPKAKASYVLEMNGGSASRNGINVASVLTFPK